MESVRSTQKKYCSRVLGFAVVVGFGLVLAGERALGKGLVLGALFSSINFVLIGQSLPYHLGRSRRQSVLVSLVSILARYAALSLPLVLAIRSDRFSLPATVVGLFGIQAAILAEQIGALLPKPEA